METAMVLGRVQQAAGRLDPARETLEAALRLSQDINHLLLEVQTRCALADCLLAQGHLDPALHTIRLAQRLAEGGEYLIFEADAALLAARIQQARGEEEEARSQAEQAAELSTMKLDPQTGEKIRHTSLDPNRFDSLLHQEAQDFLAALDR